MICYIDLAGEFLYTNPAFKSTGRSPETLLGRSVLDFIHPADRQSLSEALELIRCKQHSLVDTSGIYRFKSAYGIYFELDTRARLVDDHVRGEPVISIIGGNITCEREVARLKSDLVATGAHELRTPMTSIPGFSEQILNRANLPPARHR